MEHTRYAKGRSDYLPAGTLSLPQPLAVPALESMKSDALLCGVGWAGSLVAMVAPPENLIAWFQVVGGLLGIAVTVLCGLSAYHKARANKARADWEEKNPGQSNKADE